MHVLQHNQKVSGVKETACFEDYKFLADCMLSYCDPIGNTFTMPCCNPKHKVRGNNVFENELKFHCLARRNSVEDPDESEVVDDEHEYCDLLVQSRKTSHQSLTDRLCIAPEETEAIICTY
mgnify:CR=1 FL=1